MWLSGKVFMRRGVDTGKIRFTEEEQKALMDAIHGFFYEEYEEDLGIIKQQRILDLFTEELAGIVYNKALDDAMRLVKRQQDDLESDFYSLYKEVR